ncbi:MAG: 3-isopropylmalate/(R)-2-methylmalate dehydratase large subunit [Oceanicoccus sp.]|jgi:3-isopropylmalate/(R)-2-methylmalate dehydratase large subunit
MAKTLFEKLWQQHVVADLGDDNYLIYIDRIFLHERTGSIALKSLEADQRSIRDRARVFCTMDHIVDTFPGRSDNTLMPSGHLFIKATRESANAAGITLYDIDDQDQGIAHVISAEQAIALPGTTLVCPDSHTCTLGGIGALAWGIGSSEAEHALATNTLRVQKPKTMRVLFEGELSFGVTAKDMILHLIAAYDAAGGSGYAIEFAGSAIRALAVEARLTLCNMAVEFSAFSGIIAPDQTVIDYIEGKPYAPKGVLWQQALSDWQQLNSDQDAHFDHEIIIDATTIEPTVTWGTSPQHASAISALIPDPAKIDDTNSRESVKKALNYQGLEAGQQLNKLAIDAAFIGSCTNSRISDLRAVANLVEGQHVASHVSAVIVPGSRRVKRQAEAEGLDKIFTAAGFEWRDSGCSMCFYAGGETFGPGKRVISSTNRNFEGRQGPGTRTHLASPVTVAASALSGRITDPRELMQNYKAASTAENVA